MFFSPYYFSLYFYIYFLSIIIRRFSDNAENRGPYNTELRNNLRYLKKVLATLSTI